MKSRLIGGGPVNAAVRPIIVNVCPKAKLYMLRIVKWLTISSAILFGLFVIGVAVATAPYRELNAWNRDVISRLEIAKARPPEGVTLTQWETIVGWTENAFPNVFFTPDYVIDAAAFDNFKKQLAARLNGDVDLDTIAWIWEQLAIHGKNGADYARKYRSVAPFGKIHLDENGEPFENVRLAK